MAVISQYLGGVMTFPLSDINPYQPSSASYFCNLQSFDKVLVLLLPFHLLNYPHYAIISKNERNSEYLWLRNVKINTEKDIFDSRNVNIHNFQCVSYKIAFGSCA